MKNISETKKREYGIFPYLWYFLTKSSMCVPYNVSQMIEQFLSGRINKDTNIFDETENKKDMINKSMIDASPLSCFLVLMYDPKAPLSVFFMVELDLKNKGINQKHEDMGLKEKIKEKDVQKKTSSSISLKT